MSKSPNQKRIALANLESGSEELAILVSNDYRVEQLSDYHFRVNERLHVWPSTRKFYDPNTQKKGRYEKLEELVKSIPSL